MAISRAETHVFVIAASAPWKPVARYLPLCFSASGSLLSEAHGITVRAVSRAKLGCSFAVNWPLTKHITEVGCE